MKKMKQSEVCTYIRTADAADDEIKGTNDGNVPLVIHAISKAKVHK